MAMRHRKLFPTLSAINQTVDCPDFCDPTCPYNCYPYPDYYFQPPPPPPPTFRVDDLEGQNHRSSAFVIVSVSLLAGLFLIASYYVIIIKSCFGWRSSRNNGPPQAQSDGTDEEFLDENRVDHPIWFITTVGLQQSIINSITVCKYKKGEGLIEGTECSVCLNEFQEEETLRLLPKCNHAFHIPCIDTWLRSHTNCPLCRSRIVLDTVSSPLASIERNSYHLSLIVDTQMENSEIGDELGDNQERNGELCENRAGTDDGGELVEATGERVLKEGVNSNGNGDILSLSDSIDNHQAVNDEIQPVRRSVSMDSFSAATICLDVANCCPGESEENSMDTTEDAEKSQLGIVAKQDGGHSGAFRPMSGSSIAQCLHKRPVSMKRSVSCSGRFLSSRHNRNLNAILPL